MPKVVSMASWIWQVVQPDTTVPPCSSTSIRRIVRVSWILIPGYFVDRTAMGNASRCSRGKSTCTFSHWARHHQRSQCRGVAGGQVTLLTDAAGRNTQSGLMAEVNSSATVNGSRTHLDPGGRCL